MSNALYIRVENGYQYIRMAGKEVRILVAPVLNRYRKVLEFDSETGDLLLEAEFTFDDGRILVEEEPIWLNDVLCWAFHEPEEVIRQISEIVLE
ncbi:MAG: hypothetical protein IJ486_10020 [Firmicutes bacterium]|nr:hypothetical protein [Bacillota bacterium]